MSVYYMIIDLKHIKLIEKFIHQCLIIDKFNGCITVDGKNDTVYIIYHIL